jgi:uncharacterized membrane protein
MPDIPELRVVGGIVFGAGVALGTFVAASWFVSPLAAAVPALLVMGLVLVLAGMDMSEDDGPPTAEDLEGGR